MYALLVLIALVSLVFVWLRHRLSYWHRHGFAHFDASFPFGNLLDVFKRKSSFGVHMYGLYRQTSERLIGMHLFLRPALLVRDAGLAKRILTKDFNSFHDRGTFHNPSADPLSGHMFNMPGAEWRAMRTQLTPTFTTGKLRSMMSTILVEGENLKRYLKPFAEKGQVLPFKDVLGRFSLNIFGSVGFGLDVDTLNNPDHEFVQIEHIVNGSGLINSARLVFAFLCPSILHFFHTYANPLEARHYFIEMTKKMFEYRETNQIIRKDFIQLLLQLRNQGKVGLDDEWDIGKGQNDATKTLSLEKCAAQSYLFYLAGFDTSSATLSYTLFEVVRNPEVMKKLIAEIDETLAKHNNEISYDAIQDMKYMELCILETVRKYPTLPILNRISTEDYKVPDSDLVIPKQTPIIISLLGIGRDAKNFPQPERYYPERFAEETKLYDENAFLAFGEGPRMCIGLRLGKMIAKIGLVQLLRSYDFECVNDAEIEFEKFSVTLVPIGGVEMRVKERCANRV